MTTCIIPLPPGFRRADFFEFHNRDRQAFAERTSEDTLQKGIVWNSHPAGLTLGFHPQHVEATLDIDGAATSANIFLEATAKRMLGLTQPIDIFEEAYRGHPQIGQLITQHPGLRVPLAASPFEALTWAVTGQQISIHAAVALRRKLIQAAGIRHSSGLGCYPDAPAVAAMNLESLRQAGFSQSKAQTLLTVSRMVESGELPLDAWMADMPPADEIRARLLSIRGIGPWTVNYTLLRGFGWLDGALHGDAGVRRGLQTLLQSPQPVTEAQARTWLAEFAPWRALIAAHLWALNAG